jgi:hypothetical protein
MPDEAFIPIPVSLLRRICLAILEMRNQGAITSDWNLEGDLEKTIAEWERKQKPNGT